jgi:hypothetical protein
VYGGYEKAPGCNAWLCCAIAQDIGERQPTEVLDPSTRSASFAKQISKDLVVYEALRRGSKLLIGVSPTYNRAGI